MSIFKWLFRSKGCGLVLTSHLHYNRGYQGISKCRFFLTRVKIIKMITHQPLPSILIICDSTQQLFRIILDSTDMV